MAKSKITKQIFRLIKQIGILGYNKKRNIYGLNPIFISIIYILLTLLLATLARTLIKRFFNNFEALIRNLLLEFIATLELCACCFELIIVADNWGILAYAVSLLLLTIWWSLKWEEATACPYNPMEDIICGLKTIKDALIVICVQIIAALLTYRYVKILWSLELTETHRGKVAEECTADLQVDMIMGALIEAALTCCCRLMSRTLTELQWKFSGYMDAFFSTTMVVIAFNFSGGYFNPALATSLKLGCKGNTFVEHFVVYWLGSCLGAIISVFIFNSNSVQNRIKLFKPKVE